MSEAFERIREALIARTGHHYYSDKERLLRTRLHERAQALGLRDLDRYEARLNADETEWRALEDATTIGETYFFRYSDHFAALKADILPRLIESRRATKALRIWSIGCSTGAEPYSIAIVLRDLLGAEIDEWRISIIGGDISEKALAAAREARYGQWALRTLGPAERELYFDKQDARTWRLKPAYRAMVRFERQNVLDILSSTPPLAWRGFDLIFCRNVLIYFAPEAALQVSTALRAGLSEGGALILGHAEAALLAEPELPRFPTLSVGEPLAFEPEPAPAPQEALAPLPVIAPPPRATPPPPPQTNGAPAEPVSAAEIETLCDLADAGAYQRASALAEELIVRDPTSALLRYYQALLAQVCDDAAAAEAAFKRALYLDRNFILAHYRLGLLLLARRKNDEARRELTTAAELAGQMPEDSAIPYGAGVSAANFRVAVRNVLGSAA